MRAAIGAPPGRRPGVAPLIAPRIQREHRATSGWVARERLPAHPRIRQGYLEATALDPGLVGACST